MKTLALDGAFFWDRALDPATYPLRRLSAGAPAPERGRLWELAASGEVVLGRGVQERIARYGDATRPFARVREVLRRADLAVATLEAPLSGNGNRYCDTCMRFVGDESYAGALADAGLDVLSLANNHIGDAGPQGVVDTLRALGAAGLVYVGAGADERAARRPAFVTVRGVRLAFLGYSDVPGEYGATLTRAGGAFFTHDAASYERIRTEIAEARAQAEVVIVIAHWGIEYEDGPRPWVVEAAHAMVDGGASLVLGTHPHWVQPVELYRGGYIAYSLGNFVFDQMWSMETRRGTVHRLYFDGPRLVSVRVLPTLIEDWHQPRFLEPAEAIYRLTLERVWKSVAPTR